MTRPVVLVFLCIALAVLTGSGLSEPEEAREYVVKRQDFTKYLTFTGELQAVDKVAITVPRVSRTSNLVISHLMPEGTIVQGGDILAQFDVTELESQRLEREKQREDARTKIAQKEAELETRLQDLLLTLATAEKEVKRTKLWADVDPHLIPGEEADRYRYEFENATIELEKAQERLETLRRSREAELRVVQLEFEEADLRLKRINAELEKLTIRAPIPGVVIYAINFSTRAKVQVGDTVWSRWPLIYLPNMNSVQIDTFVYDSDLPLLNGQEYAEVVFDAAPGKTFHGEITYLPKVAKPREPGSQLKAFKAVVLLPEVDRELMKPGMTARVRVPVGLEDVLVVPRSALILGPDGSTLVSTPSGPLEVVTVDANERSVVVEGGIEEGQELLRPNIENRAAVVDTDWFTVERQDCIFSVSGSGTLEAEEARFIGPPPLRRVWSFKIAQMIPEGMNVQKGDLLVSFDPTEIEERLREERANLEKVDEELRKTQASEELKVKDLEIQLEEAAVQKEKAENKLIQQKAFGSILEAREAEYEAELAVKRLDSLQKKHLSVRRHVELQIKILEDRRRLHQYRITENEAALEELTVEAPISGVVIYETNWRNEKKHVGSEVHRGEQIMSLPDLNTLLVKGQIAEVDAGKVGIGQPVNIAFDALPDKTFTGTLRRVSSMFRRASRDQPVKVLEVEVELDALDKEAMRPGMVARLGVVFDRFSDVLAVPLSTIRVKDGRSFVWVRGQEGPEERVVEVGRDNGLVAVIESGLREGEEIADRAMDTES